MNKTGLGGHRWYVEDGEIVIDGIPALTESDLLSMLDEIGEQENEDDYK